MRESVPDSRVVWLCRLTIVSLFLQFSCVWIILGFELLFELLIRPTDYKELIRSEKAFAPSTARNINAFHLCFESLSLLLFIPRLPCVFWRQCGDDIYLSNVWASVRSVSGTRGTAAVARFCLGLSFLRAFGLFRHWKQMWINRIFERGKTDSCKSGNVFYRVVFQLFRFLIFCGLLPRSPPATPVTGA